MSVKFGPVASPEEIRRRYEEAKPFIKSFAEDIEKGRRLSPGCLEWEVTI